LRTAKGGALIGATSWVCGRLGVLVSFRFRRGRGFRLLFGLRCLWLLLRLVGELLAGLIHGVVELLLVDARLVEGVTALAVREGELGGDADVLVLDLLSALPGGVGAGGAGDDEVAAHAVDVEGGAHGRDAGDVGVGELHRVQKRRGRGEAAGDVRIRLGPLGDEGLRVLVEGQAALHDLRADRDVAGGRHVEREAEAVEQLRAKLALLRVHGAHQHEVGRG